MAFVDLEQRGSIGILTMNRPEALNALNDQVLRDLDAALDAVEANDEILVVILTGAGRSFVAGADIGQMKDFTSVQAKKFGAYGNSVFLKLENFPKPVIAAAHGAIAGAGTMGYSLAQAFSAAGYPVKLYDLFPAALDKARDMIALNQQTEVTSGKLTAEQSAALIGRISLTSQLEDLANTDFLVEAILEKLEVKHDFYRQLCAVVAEDAILCSNTSGLSITKIAEAVTHPERFAGMHWMNPPHIIPLIEIVEGEKTAPETAECVRQVALGMKKKPVIVKDAPSFVLNRLQQAILRESLHIVQQGIASPEAVDDVMKYALGFRYACFGPFETCDLGGLDIHHNIAKYTFADLCNATEPFGLISECIEHDRLGVKNGAGFYDYSDGKDVEVIRHRDHMFNKLAQCLFEDEE